MGSWTSQWWAGRRTWTWYADATGSEKWPAILGPLLQRLDQVSYYYIRHRGVIVLWKR